MFVSLVNFGLGPLAFLCNTFSNFLIIMHPLQKTFVQHALKVQMIELKYGLIVQN
jgi:hypothetical protein